MSQTKTAFVNNQAFEDQRLMIKKLGGEENLIQYELFDFTPVPKEIRSVGMKSLKPFSLLIKPASADCNLRCEYCFYLGKSTLYPQTKTHRMSDEVLEQVIKKYLSIEQPVYTFSWQGGEPTLMGTHFFKRITELQKKHARQGSQIANALQTNATLITDTLAEHLVHYRFLVGCSLDESPELHNRYRRYISGRSSHAAVLKGIEILRRHGVEFNILVLASKAYRGIVGGVRIKIDPYKQKGIPVKKY